MRTRRSLDPCACGVARRPAEVRLRVCFHRLVLALSLGTGAGITLAEPARVSPNVLPETLRQQWIDLRPSFNEHSRCAVVWDPAGDPGKQLLRCSIYMRMGAEAERRAMFACEEFRAEQKIRAPCRLVIP